MAAAAMFKVVELLDPVLMVAKTEPTPRDELVAARGGEPQVLLLLIALDQDPATTYAALGAELGITASRRPLRRWSVP